MSEVKNSRLWAVGILVSLVGAICFSTKAIFVKLAYRDSDVDAITLLALRMLFSLPFFVITAFFFSRKETNVRFTSRQWLYVAVVGCLGYYVSSLLDFWGLKYISAGIERLLLFIYPTFVLLISAWWLGKSVSRRQWVAVAITYFGLCVAFFSEMQLHTDEHFFLGSGLILLCTLTYATSVAGSGSLIPKVGAMKFNSYAMSFASVGVLAHFFIFSNNSLFDLPAIIYLYGILMAIISTVIPSYLVSASIKRLGANNTAIIASVGPVSTILQAYYFLGENVSWLQLIGTCFIIAGVLLISWRPSKDDADSEATKSKLGLK